MAAVLRLRPADDDGVGSRVHPETRAAIPEPHGAPYRLTVLGTGGHVVVTRRLLARVARRAERTTTGA